MIYVSRRSYEYNNSLKFGSLMKSTASKLFKSSRTLYTAIDVAFQCN